MGSVAVFRCSHSSDDISWIINGRPAALFSDAKIGSLVDDDKSLVFTVSITANPANNGTRVVCRSNLPQGAPELSRPALLNVIAGWHNVTSLHCTVLVTVSDSFSWRKF